MDHGLHGAPLDPNSVESVVHSLVWRPLSVRAGGREGMLEAEQNYKEQGALCDITNSIKPSRDGFWVEAQVHLPGEAMWVETRVQMAAYKKTRLHRTMVVLRSCTAWQELVRKHANLDNPTDSLRPRPDEFDPSVSELLRAAGVIAFPPITAQCSCTPEVLGVGMWCKHTATVGNAFLLRLELNAIRTTNFKLHTSTNFISPS